ncbi:fungal transcriptional regulatory-like protein [Apiospora saccharicola]
MSMSVAPLPGVHPVAMSRPQVGIERLPTRRMSNEPREGILPAKIKCNRLRPACEACQVFQCPCIYDAVPKKRGPKTDVLEALLKRVDGLEQKLKDQKNSDSSPGTDEASALAATETISNAGSAESATSASAAERSPKRQEVEVSQPKEVTGESAMYSPPAENEASPGVQTDALLDTYFTCFHAKPFYILDESSVRQRLQLNQLPVYLIHAIYSVAARYTPHPSGYQSAVRLGEEYALRARDEISTDEPSVDALQALLLLVIAFTAAGKGKRAYMLMTNAVGMAMALELHREVDLTARITPVERETRRRLFWTCYLLDRFMACGSKRPGMIGDKSILLRLPYWSLNPNGLPIEGEFFQRGSNHQYLQGSGKKCQGSSGMLIDITRILGITNQYLAAGGVKGDSHFPWHSLSNLSKIRHDLDIWASGTEDVFCSVDSLFGQPDSTVLVLSKLVYHLIHCLIYRPFIPIDLAELAGTGQHHSWQIEATNMCFLHANAIAELVELGKQTATIEWPSFVGYCICTAGTVHIHGAHYNKIGMNEMGAFSSSTDFLSREMQQLSELRYAWASVQHQRETLQSIYNAHAELVKTLANNPMRYSPVFQLGDFFERYSNIGDVVVDFATDTYTGHDLYAPRHHSAHVEPGIERPSLKRKSTGGSVRKRPDLRTLGPILQSTGEAPLHTPGLPTPGGRGRSQTLHVPPQPSPGALRSPVSLSGRIESIAGHAMPPTHHNMMEDVSAKAAAAAAAAAGYPMSPGAQSQQPPGYSNSHYSPHYTFTGLQSGGGPGPNTSNGDGHLNVNGYDPMFGTVPTNAFSSPAAWHGGEDDRKTVPMHVAPSPGARSHNDGSVGTGPGEEKDPFLSLLEQLAESEHAQGQGNDLDIFLSGTQG